MGTRRLSRERALQALFYMDMHRDPVEDPVGQFCSSFAQDKPTQPFFHRLVDGVQENRAAIDTVIEQFSSNWKLSRMSCVDRNVLRIAVFELLYCADIPPKVSITRPSTWVNASVPMSPVPSSMASWTASAWP